MERKLSLRAGLLCLTALTTVASCGKFDGRTISSAGAGVVLAEPLDPYSETNLVALIKASIGKTKQPVESTTQQGSPPAKQGGAPATPVVPPTDLADEIGSFSAMLYTDTSDEKKRVDRQNQLRDARNQVQGALMTRSGNLCNAFKQQLHYRTSTVNFGLGTAAVLFGTAGAVLTGTAAQALAAAAAAASGTQAEYNQDFLSGLTTSVIIPGIDKQRTGLQQEIVKRQCLGVSSYTLSQALLDAVRYHAACSTDVGIASAASAISQSRTTSLTEAKATLDAVAALATTADLISKGGGSGEKLERSAAAQFDPSKLVPLGEPVNFLQCQPLDASGLLPDPPAEAKPKATLVRQRSKPASPAAASESSSLRRSRLLLPFSGQVPFGVY